MNLIAGDDVTSMLGASTVGASADLCRTGETSS